MRVAAIIAEAKSLPVPVEEFLGKPVTCGDTVIGSVVEAEIQDGMVLTVLQLDNVNFGLDSGLLSELSL